MTTRTIPDPLRPWTLDELTRLAAQRFRDLVAHVQPDNNPDLWAILTEELRQQTATALVTVRAHVTAQLAERNDSIAELTARTSRSDPQAVARLDAARAQYDRWRPGAFGFYSTLLKLIGDFEHDTNLTVDEAASGQTHDLDNITTLADLARAIAEHRAAAGRDGTDADRQLWATLDDAVVRHGRGVTRLADLLAA